MGVQPIAVPQSLARMLNAAGDKSGVDFDYLLKTAIRESSLDPEAKARTSTATGLFQFLESTWLEVMKTQGPKLGYQAYADAITETREGDFVIADKTLREKILKLREDPGIASDLAAAFTRSNGDYLTARFGRRPSAGELYIAHFLGARGAEKLFTAGLENPDQSAPALFPRQARANPTIFYAGGEARSIRQVYLSLVAKHGAPAPVPAFAAQQMAYQPLASSVTPLLGGSPAATAAPGGTEPIPSRYSPADPAFETLFATSADSEVRPRRLLTPQPTGTDPFFGGLYGRRDKAR